MKSMHHTIFDHRRLPPNCHAEWIMASDYWINIVISQHVHYSSHSKTKDQTVAPKVLSKSHSHPEQKCCNENAELSNQALPRKERHYNLTSDSTHMRFSTARPAWSTSIPWRCWCHCWRLLPWTCSSSQITKKNSWLQGTTRTKWRTFCICTPHQGEPLQANRLQGCRFPINPSDRFR